MTATSRNPILADLVNQLAQDIDALCRTRLRQARSLLSDRDMIIMLNSALAMVTAQMTGCPFRQADNLDLAAFDTLADTHLELLRAALADTKAAIVSARTAAAAAG